MQGIIPDFGILEWDRLPLHFFTPENGRIRWLRGIEFDIRPNLGAMGVAPASGSVPSIEPGDHGGNQDTKHVCAGSAVHFPVFHPGALLFMGDCHQIQGDGELCGVAPETDAEVTLHVELLKGKTIRRPRIMTADRFMTLASAKTLEEAVKLAVRDTVDLLVEEKGLTEDEAYLLITDQGRHRDLPGGRSADDGPRRDGPRLLRDAWHRTRNQILEALDDDSSQHEPSGTRASRVCSSGPSASGARSRCRSRRWGRSSAR